MCFMCILLKYYASEADSHTSAEVFLSQRAHTPLYISGWKELHIQLQHRYIASLILHASIAEIIAQLLSLSYV